MKPVKPPSAARQHAEWKGRLAETLAGVFLRLKAYHIIETRWRAPTGEIDLIAQKGKILVFIEVKTRTTEQAARNAVSWQNRRRIERTAACYLAHKRYQPQPPCRFDIITLSGLRLTHHRAAWREGE